MTTYYGIVKRWTATRTESAISGLRGALRHLTLLPMGWTERDAALRAASTLAWFPVVGVAIGSAVAGILVLPIPSLPRAALALLLWTALTRGLHEDGLMDSADAAFAIASRERRLQILRDPHAGAHGITALLLVLIVRMAALTETPAIAAPVAAMTGRWAMTLTLSLFRPARSTGLGATFSAGAQPVPPTVVAAACLATLCAIGGSALIAPSIAGTAAGLLTAYGLDRRFGGLTGDAHGASCIAAETTALFAFAW